MYNNFYVPFFSLQLLSLFAEFTNHSEIINKITFIATEIAQSSSQILTLSILNKLAASVLGSYFYS